MSGGRLVLVSGTGTEIGKTHLSTALLRASALNSPSLRMAGIKPVETGAPAGGLGADAETLGRVSTFHVKHSPPYMLRRAVSPHLAARDEGVALELAPIVDYVQLVRAESDLVLVELAGGLFSPLGPSLTNADIARALGADLHVLVGPDRLGVLHDVSAALRAATALAPAACPDVIVLVAPAAADASTGTNAAELPVVTDVPVAAVVPRAPVETLALRRDVRALATRFLG